MNDDAIGIFLTDIGGHTSTCNEYLLITDTNLQLPFKSKIMTERTIIKAKVVLEKYLDEKYRESQKAIITILNQGRGHWCTIVIKLTKPHCELMTHYGISVKVVDSLRSEENHNIKQEMFKESGKFIEAITDWFAKKKYPEVEERKRLQPENFSIISSQKQSDHYSCGDYSLSCVKMIIERKIFIGRSNKQEHLKEINISDVRSKIRKLVEDNVKQEDAEPVDNEMRMRNKRKTIC